MLLAENSARGRGRASRLGAGAARQMRPQMLGRSRPAALGGIGALVILALGVPVGAIIYLLVKGGNSTLPAASLASAAGHTFLYAGAAGVIATVAALPIALLSVRFPRREVRFLERANMLVLCVPGLVIALSFTFFTEHYLAGHLYQTPLLLVLAYAVMFFPMAVVAVRASVARSPVGLEEVGSSLGVPPAHGLPARHPPAHRPGPGGGVLPGLSRGGHRAHRHAGAHPDQRPDAGHPVLGLPDQSLLQPSGALCRA